MDSTIKVIVVDDEEMVRKNLTAFLEDENFEVVSVSNADEALKALAEEKVDIGVIDMRLPSMDGNALILKAHEIVPDMKFLIHTGSANYSLPASLRTLGISNDQVFHKPIPDMTVLVDAIMRLVGRGTWNDRIQ